MPKNRGEYIADIFEFSIEDSVVHIWTADWEIFAPLPKFRRSMARAAKALADYDGRKADVVPLRRGKRAEH